MTNHDTLAHIDTLRAVNGKRQFTASGARLISTWWEHPTRTAAGKLRSYEACERISRANHREHLALWRASK